MSKCFLTTIDNPFDPSKDFDSWLMFDTEKDYNIYRNHLYQIGQRGAGDTGEGGGPDEPQPLDKDQILTIKINDQWEFIHDLEID